MQVKRLISSILTKPWLIEQGTAENLLPVLDSILMGNQVPFSEEKPEQFYYIESYQNGQKIYPDTFDEAPAGSVAVIHLRGVMMREDSYWDYGTSTLAAITKVAIEHPNIAAIVKVVASGGGSVDGTEVYASVLGSSTKPVVTYVEGMMASAAYWVGAKAKHIMLEGKSTIIGSIGTQFTVNDRTEQYEKLGIKTHLVRATASTQKNKDVEEVLNGNYKPLIKNTLDPLNNVFLAEVRAARAGKLDEENYPLDGRILIGQAAIDAGLADSFGTLQDAIDLALKLAQDTSNVNNLNTDMSLFGSKKFAAVAALAAVEAISAEQLTAANEELEKEGITGAKLISEADYNALSDKAGQVDALQSENAQLRSDKQVLDNTVAGLEKDLEEANALVAKYGGLPGATHTAATSTKPEITGETSEQKPALDDEAAAYVAMAQRMNANPN